MGKQYFWGYFSYVLLGRKLENLFCFSFSGTRNIIFGTLKIGQIDWEIPNFEYENHGFFKNPVFLPTEQAGTNICWIIYQDANFKICLSLFGWKENILHKRWNASEKENEFSISNHISFEKPETKFPRRSWTILFLQNRGQTNSTFIWRVLSAWACVKLWLNFLKMFMGKFAYSPMLTFQQLYFRVMN